MAYATPEDFLRQCQTDETVELSQQDDPDAILAAGDRLAAALDNATDEIHSFIGGRYSPLPIAPTPKYLRYACIVIARKQLDLYLEREKVIRDYEDVVIRLSDIRDRKSVLIGADGKPVPEASTAIDPTTPRMSLNCV